MKSKLNLPEAKDNLQPVKGLRTLKYLQLVDYINRLIEEEEINIDEQLPSIKQLQQRLSMSKETVLKGLNYLAEKGIIEAVYRKGYYVRKKSVNHSYRIFLLLDKMNIIRDTLYHSLFDMIKDDADIDIYFHHHNFKVFSKLIQENLGNYTHFVVATFLKEDPSGILNLIPPHKRIIIDYDHPNLSGEYASIYQDFKADIYESLTKLLPHIRKYEQLVLIAPPESFHAHLIVEGFLTFCREFDQKYIIQHEILADNFKKGNLYITLSRYDTDEVTLIKLLRDRNYQLGKEIGLISYNNSAVKEILEGGLTVISTDFGEMAKEVAHVIYSKQYARKRNPTEVIFRKSV